MPLPPTLELVRPLNCVLTGVAVLIGAVVAVGGADIPGITLISAFAAAALVAGGGNAINDYFDRKIDRINRPERPIPSGRIEASEALKTAQVLLVFGIAFTVFLNPYCVVLAGFNAFVLATYAWGLKRRGLIGNIAIGYLVGSTFLFGGLATESLRAGPIIPTALLVLVLMAALSTAGRELIKGIQDMPGDRKLRFKTFPLRYGAGKAAALAIGFMGAAIALSPLPYLLRIFELQYLAAVVISIAAFIAAAVIIARSRTPKSAGQASLACKIGMGLGLLAFLVGVSVKLL